MILQRLLQASPDELATCDIAVVNLCAAEGLPGAGGLDIARCLATLDLWADAVRRFTRDNRGDYQRDPERFHRQRGYFHFLSMVTLLKHPRGIGVGYQPAAIGNMRFLDSRDDLLHGLLTRKLGTCTSLPTLFVAIGRRLGWPMHLSVAISTSYANGSTTTGAGSTSRGPAAGAATCSPTNTTTLGHVR